MKKILSLFIVALLAIAFVSCKKDYTCKCNYTSTYSIYGYDYLTDTIVVTGTNTKTSTTEKTFNNSKKKAESDCKSEGYSTVDEDGNTEKMDCTIQ
ncbi:MAG: hypothetical protein A2X12_00165 [Bacteroidetes bacterium GWE2_29_8]|nr:MAG: hypothetical protein A2X12_00165 [Bacteroidetes bacterium GWE2_29_8]OFY20114.1 MAG: hypothetical protein A2X02_07050 [Bacteroidetes bacterium GWF2_29_10]